MKKFKVTIDVMETIEASISTSLVIEAENRVEAKKRIAKMLDAFERDTSPLADELAKLCEDDIRDFHDDQDTWDDINVGTDIISIEEVSDDK
jgi:hypothetical protein